MAIPTLKAVGYSAHFSAQGDWAFDYALRLARLHSLQLNVFHFLSDPYDPTDDSAAGLTKPERARLAVEREKELRLYYDRRAGDYLDVGFRLCEDAEWTELHRCLIVREFQVLVLAHLGPTALFGGVPIEEFADSFICPIVLVGPTQATHYRLNSRATLIADRLGLAEHPWSVIQRVAV